MSQHKQQHRHINLQHIVMDFKRNEIPKLPAYGWIMLPKRIFAPPPLSSALLSTRTSKDKPALGLIITQHEESANRLESPKASQHHVITRYSVRHNASQSRLS